MPLQALDNELFYGGIVAEHRKHFMCADEVVEAVPVVDPEVLVSYFSRNRNELDEASLELKQAQDAAIDFFETAEEYQAFLERIGMDPTKVLTSHEKPFVKKIAVALIKHQEAVVNYELAEEALADKDLTVGELKAEFRKELRKMEAKVAKMEEEAAVTRELLILLSSSRIPRDVDLLMVESNKPQYSEKTLKTLLSNFEIDFSGNVLACYGYQRRETSRPKQEVLNEYIKSKGGSPIVW